MFEHADELLEPGASPERVETLLRDVGFEDCPVAAARLQNLASEATRKAELKRCLPMLLSSLAATAVPDGSLVNFERYIQSVKDATGTFRFLADNPRAVEILIRLFVGSQFLTEILIRNPAYLEQLTHHKRLADFKNRLQFVEEQSQAIENAPTTPERLDALRRYQHWELLRIGACDAFGLMDLKSVTLQLSLLADATVQSCLHILTAELDVPLEGFCIVAMGKLGGEELNYSSDIDLIFLTDRDAGRYWPLGQKLIGAISDPTAEGFLYRVDMRLRPWGQSGALVNTVDAHISYLQKHGMLWEKQALLKARPIAGNADIGHEFLQKAEPLIFGLPEDLLRKNVSQMKEKIEARIRKSGREWAEVKGAAGTIRDIEFTVQFLQMVHGGENRYVRSIGTLDGLVRLAEFGMIGADEYRRLTGGYMFLRAVEHSLQLMHHKQTHFLPEDPRELNWLARRLDYPDSEAFLAHYAQHRQSIRQVYDRYVERVEDADEPPGHVTADRIFRRVPDYRATFSAEQISLHESLFLDLSDQRVACVHASAGDRGVHNVVVVGFDTPGALSMICGLLFVYGFDILDGNVFTGEQAPDAGKKLAPGQRNQRGGLFVDAFSVNALGSAASSEETWQSYEAELGELMKLAQQGHQREAQGRLAKRVATAIREVPADPAQPGYVLYPVRIEIDNESSDQFSILDIRGTDTIGFLYGLANALALSRIDVSRVSIGTTDKQVADVLYVSEIKGGKLTDPTRLAQLKTTVALIKHFTHLLPQSPDAESALLNFQAFLEQTLDRPNWHEELSSLERSDVLTALAKLLGVSEFLWEDFLKVQHDNLFPVVSDTDALRVARSKSQMQAELNRALELASETDDRAVLNRYKDREMFRIDMRHILGHAREFGEFSAELTDLAEVIITATAEVVFSALSKRLGDAGRYCVCGLGKFGGRELGFASDIELMFFYDAEPGIAEQAASAEFFPRFVEEYRNMIDARSEGIFQLDLRLRPYGKAGSPAVTLETFRDYFSPAGPAWPYERQALVKLRPICGDDDLAQQILEARDEIIFRKQLFDPQPMRAMRDKQLMQLVKAGTFNAKLSPGGLVDIEYFVQGLQLSHGHKNAELRDPNTIAALAALLKHGFIEEDRHNGLLEAYRFLRQLIDALRMVRGNAKDLAVPPNDSEGFQFLARRLGYGKNAGELTTELERHSEFVREAVATL